MKAKGGNWTYDELFKFIKSPGAYIPGTKMSFAGLRSDKDRINLIAFLRTNTDARSPIPAPRPSRQLPLPPRQRRPVQRRLRAALRRRGGACHRSAKGAAEAAKPKHHNESCRINGDQAVGQAQCPVPACRRAGMR